VEILFDTTDMNTEQVLEIARKSLEGKKIQDIIVASTSGDTGVIAAKLLETSDMNLVVVAHSVGFKEPNINQFSQSSREIIERMGGTVIFATMPFHTINDAIRMKMGTSLLSLIADTLRIMGQGTKVCVEIVSMACDAGKIESGKEVISVSGTGKGADTVLLMKSANSRRFFDLRIIDVIAKPHYF
jgi:hypothetical protein